MKLNNFSFDIQKLFQNNKIILYKKFYKLGKKKKFNYKKKRKKIQILK